MRRKYQLATNFACVGLGVILATSSNLLVWGMGIVCLTVNAIALAGTIDGYFSEIKAAILQQTVNQSGQQADDGNP